MGMRKSILKRDFPRIENTKHQILTPFVFAIFIYLFLLIFQPFGLSEIQYYKPLYILGFFIITLLVMLLTLVFAPKIFKIYFASDTWTVQKEIIFVLINILLIAVLNWFYNSTFGNDIVSQPNLLLFLLYTFAVGIIPVVFLIFFIENYLSKKNSEIAKELACKIISTKNIKKQSINIILENAKTFFFEDSKQLICICSEGNYCNLYYTENGKLKKKLVRSSLTNIENQLIIFENIKRCHRSYIVNFHNVEKITGNARSYNLHITNLDFTIPVSRNFPKSIIDKFSN